MGTKAYNRSFGGGEISPQLFARVDLDKFQTGLAQCLNAIVLPQGPAQNRPGFGFVNQVRDSSVPSILIPFAFNDDQTFVIEAAPYFFRFHTQGQTLMEAVPFTIQSVGLTNPMTIDTFAPTTWGVGQAFQVTGINIPELEGRWLTVAAIAGTSITASDMRGNPVDATGFTPYVGAAVVNKPYEVISGYPPASLSTLNYVQSADVLTITSPLHQACELRRYGANDWRFTGIQFTSLLSPPQSNGAVPSAIDHTYRVVAVANATLSLPSLPTTCSNDLTIPGRYNVVSWAGVPGGQLYHVYKLIGGVWNYLTFSFGGTYVIDDSSVVPNPAGPFYSGIGTPPVPSATAIAPYSTGVSVVPSGGGSIEYTYVVTSLSDDAVEESLPSSPVTVTNDLGTSTNVNTVRWPAVPGVRLYNVYRSRNGIFGFVGRSNQECFFEDRNVLPDVTITPPIQINPFNGTFNYPSAVTYHEQRRVFAGTPNQPQTLWATRSGTESNLGYSFPARDDDSITARVVARKAQTIRHMIPMDDLILLTSGGEWKVSAGDSQGAITPSNISVKQQGYTGASTAIPVTTNRAILYAQARGGHIRELQFSWQQQGYQTTDVSILAPHLFDTFIVRQLAFGSSPNPVLWTVRSDGRLLGMTYVPEHEVRAWHQHETDGFFESAVVIAEGDEDVLYVIVRRTIEGQSVRYIERLHTRHSATQADQFFVDSGLTYDGAPVSAVGGLWHLEGKQVAILADGGVSPPQVVTDGRVTLDAAASKIHVGLPYRTRLKSLPLSMQVQAFGQGVQKNINKVTMRVMESNGFEAGPSFERLRPYRTRYDEPYGSPPDLTTDEAEIVVDGDWNNNGQLCIEQSQPIALTVLGMTLDVATGG